MHYESRSFSVSVKTSGIDHIAVLADSNNNLNGTILILASLSVSLVVVAQARPLVILLIFFV